MSKYALLVDVYYSNDSSDSIKNATRMNDFLKLRNDLLSVGYETQILTDGPVPNHIYSNSLITVGRPSKTNILYLLNNLAAKVSNGDEVIFNFTGQIIHIPQTANEDFLVPVEASENMEASELIANSEIQRIFSIMRSKGATIVFSVDAPCYTDADELPSSSNSNYSVLPNSASSFSQLADIAFNNSSEGLLAMKNALDNFLKSIDANARPNISYDGNTPVTDQAHFPNGTYRGTHQNARNANLLGHTTPSGVVLTVQPSVVFSTVQQPSPVYSTRQSFGVNSVVQHYPAGPAPTGYFNRK